MTLADLKAEFAVACDAAQEAIHELRSLREKHCTDCGRLMGKGVVPDICLECEEWYA